MLIEFQTINLDKYFSGEEEFYGYITINTDHVVRISDWSGENDENVDGEMITEISLDNGETYHVVECYSVVVDRIMKEQSKK